MSVSAISAVRPVLADRVRTTRLTNAMLIISGAALVGLLAQISVHLPFTPVPFTGQTFGVLFVGSALGWRRAASAMSLYVIAGLAGVPWFANHASGFVGANAGYLIGFVLAASLLGLAAARGQDRSVWRALPTMLLAEVVIFSVGVTWLAVWLHVSAAQALQWGLTPFLWGEVVKVLTASVTLPATWKVLDRFQG